MSVYQPMHSPDSKLCYSVQAPYILQIPISMANLTTSNYQGAVASPSSTSSSCASTSYSGWDVFLNHRGPDVKNTFASHLYRQLISSGLRVFLDREELEEGRNISSQIQQAIRSASVHIAIFSPRYAQSTWCLDELVLMINSGATILPVFYKVQPSVLRWTVKDGAYAEALRDLESKTTHEAGEKKPRYSSDTLQNWRKALSYVADMSGFVLNGDEDDEGELLDSVVQSVLKNVPKTQLDVAKYATGLGEKLQDFEKTVLSQQQQDEKRVGAKVVGIVGVGGVGKTTLAKEFFNLRRSDYNESSFLFEVRENTRTKSVNYLQSKLIKDLKHRDVNIESDEGTGILRKHLSFCHALMVLDDIDHVSQFEALLPMRDILSPDSLILVTSRDQSVLRSSGVLESSIYKLEGLSRLHSEELFCSYAFHQPHPPPEFADLADRFVRACDGLPLSLKVFGALVCEQNESYWEDILNELIHNIHPTTEIQDRLKISYDSLSSTDQQIFLDITCFFLGEKRDTAKRIWSTVGLQNLQNKCLLEVDGENCIKMHDHIRDMGRNISQGRDMPRRLVHATPNNIDDLLEQSSCEITEVHGISMLGVKYIKLPPMSSEMPWYKIWIDEVFGNCLRHLVNNSRFSGILNLEIVAVEDGYYLERILKKVRSPHLKWLRWYKCPYSCLPSWIPMENLKVLEVAGNRLKTLWQHDSQVPLQLLELNIFAPSFSSIPKSIGQLRHLQHICIVDDERQEGIALKSLPEEFCELRSLKFLYLCRCQEMRSLPDNFGMLTNLQDISLFGASSLQFLPGSFGNLTRLKHLDLHFCRSLTISSTTLGNITTLERLDLRNCSNVGELPPQVAHQRSLQKLLLSGANLKELPSWIGDLCNLEALSIGNDLLEVLPPLLSHLKSLKYLWLTDSPKLKSLPDHFELFTQLRWLIILDCGIEYLPQDLPKMNSLEWLSVRNCPLLELPFKKIEGERETGRALSQLESFHDHDNCMFGLQELDLFSTEISEVFFPEGVCPNLRILSLAACEKLTQIGALCGLSKLHRLYISGCARVEELPNIEMLISLEVLNVSGCKKLKSIPGLGQLISLRKLDVHECHEILELSGVRHLMLLKKLDAHNCPKLRWGGSVLEQLRQRLKEGLIL